MLFWIYILNIYMRMCSLIEFFKDSACIILYLYFGVWVICLWVFNNFCKRGKYFKD